MRIVIKPTGAILLLGTLAILVVLALRPRGEASGPDLSTVASLTRAAEIPAPQSEAPAPAAIYTGSLQNGWEGYGWAKVLDLADTRHTQPGQTASIRALPHGYEAVYLHHAPFVPSEYDRLTFYINGGKTGGQTIRLHILFPEVKTGPSTAEKKIEANATYGRTLEPLPTNSWRPVTVRLADFGIRGQQKMAGIWWINPTPNPIPEFYISNVRFLKPGEPDPAAR